MKAFDAQYLNDLTGQEKNSLRLRQHRNIHQNYLNACKRLFNAIEPGSYIRPHRHAPEPRDELLIAILRSMAMRTFDDQGSLTGILRFGSEKHGIDLAAGAEAAASTWRILVTLEPSCVLLEVKAGPFAPNLPKELAPWAPEQGSEVAADYLNRLLERITE